MSDHYLFDPRAVKLDETTFRVDSTRAQDLKSRALAAYFAPSELAFVPCDHPPDSKDNDPVTWYAGADTVAVLNRLDVVLGQDGWSETYETIPGAAGSAVRCTIRARFAPDGEWVQRSAVGTGITDKAAHRDAFERAAVKYGVARYLYDLPPLVAPLDKPTERPKQNPRLPEACLPIAFRRCGEQVARSVCEMLESCLQAAKVHPSRGREAMATVAADYGYTMNTKPPAWENRHAGAMLQRLVDWRGAIEKGTAHPAKLSPFAGTKEANEGKLSEPIVSPDGKPPEKKPDPTKDVKPSTKLAPPATGDELATRLEIKDKALADQGKIERHALKAYVLEKGAKLNYSADLSRWNSPMIQNALKWANEYMKELGITEVETATANNGK